MTPAMSKEKEENREHRLAFYDEEISEVNLT